MDIDVMAELAATVGDLGCGCPFDRDGLHRLGDWVQCTYHHAPAPVIFRRTVATGHAVLGA
ncbi:hypothetical protein [Saccharopolyspora taberi]|uniref:Uncharacterized protein n=1 Tax=Saccharopolyspora taberi TaxID=60895 RepID=A0ABN3VF61_9PSEU